MKYDFDPLADNPQRRVPICLCLDTSGSMRGKPIYELNEGIKTFLETIRHDDVARDAADICLITFGGDRAEKIADFAGVDYHRQLPTLNANGYTPIGGAINMALDSLEKRKREYKQKGVQYYQPWLVVMTDGYPEGESSDKIERAKSRVAEMVANKKLVVISVAIGDDADMDLVRSLSTACGRLKDLKFREFFKWLSQSVTSTSHSNGQKITIQQPSKGFFDVLP